MRKLTEYTSYADAQSHFGREALWALFDGDRQALSVTHECVDRHDPARTAIRITHADGRYETITFGTLSACSSRCANYLMSNGIKPGERIGIMLDPGLAFYASFFGAMKMGAVAVPLFTLFGSDGLHLRIDNCTPAMLILSPAKADLAASAPCRTVIADDDFMAELSKKSADFEASTAGEDMAMYQYTSGTSRDLPEAVKHRHKSIVTVAVAALYGTGVRPGDKFMCPSSPAWGHGLWHGTLAPLGLGVEIAAYSGPFEPARLAAAIGELGITNLSAAATHFRMMKNAGVLAGATVPLEKISYTGEALDDDTAAWIHQTFGQEARSIYGSTEVGVLVVGYPGAADFQFRRGSLGKPVPGVDVAVLDGDNRPCPPGTVGEIKVKRRGEWYPIKDLGRTDEDGHFYHAGRTDDVIISAGWTLSPLDMEGVLLKHPDVHEVAVIAAPDDERGEIAEAHVISHRPGDDRFISELQAFAKTRLARHEYPRRVVFADHLPKTPAGKINRRALRDMHHLDAEPESP